MFAQGADTAQRWRSGKVSERSATEVSCGQLPLARCRWALHKPRANNVLIWACQHITNKSGVGLVCGGKQGHLAGWDEGNPHTSCAAESRSEERLATVRSAVSNLGNSSLWMAV